MKRVQGSGCSNGFRYEKLFVQFRVSFDLFGCLLCLQACILAVGKAEQQVLVDEESEKG